MVDYGLMGAMGEGLKSFVDSYRTERNYQNQKKEKADEKALKERDYQNQNKKDAEEKAIKTRLARAQEVDSGAKMADTLGYIPKGFLSSDVEALYNGTPSQDSSSPGMTQSGGAPTSGTGLMDKPSSPGLMSGPAIPQGASSIQGDGGFLTRPMDTKIMPKHVREGIKEATHLSASNYGKGVVYKYDPDARVVRQFAAPRSAEHQIELDNKTLQNQKTKEELQNVKPEQGQAALYGKRMVQAEDVFSKLGKSDYDRTQLSQGVQAYLPGMLQSNEFKQQNQAERNFINAILRRESGAAISPNEFSSAEQQYFDRGGDTPEVKAQKKENRLLAIEGMKQQAGPKTWAGLNAPHVAVTLPKQKGGLVKEAVASGVPKAGEVQDGYKYNGKFPPGDKRAWEKM